MGKRWNNFPRPVVVPRLPVFYPFLSPGRPAQRKEWGKDLSLLQMQTALLFAIYNILPIKSTTHRAGTKRAYYEFCVCAARGWGSNLLWAVKRINPIGRGIMAERIRKGVDSVRSAIKKKMPTNFSNPPMVVFARVPKFTPFEGPVRWFGVPFYCYCIINVNGERWPASTKCKGCSEKHNYPFFACIVASTPWMVMAETRSSGRAFAQAANLPSTMFYDIPRYRRLDGTPLPREPK